MSDPHYTQAEIQSLQHLGRKLTEFHHVPAKASMPRSFVVRVMNLISAVLDANSEFRRAAIQASIQGGHAGYQASNQISLRSIDPTV
jgi:hypothetical protein